jgi:hypothetical protein
LARDLGPEVPTCQPNHTVAVVDCGSWNTSRRRIGHLPARAAASPANSPATVKHQPARPALRRPLWQTPPAHRPDSFRAALAHLCVLAVNSTLSGVPPSRASIRRDADRRETGFALHRSGQRCRTSLPGHRTQAPKLLPPLSAAIRSRAWMAGAIRGTPLYILVRLRPVTHWPAAFKPRPAIPSSEALRKSPCACGATLSVIATPTAIGRPR